MKKIITFLLPLVLFSCSDVVEITENQAVCMDIYSKMKEWYLWNDRIPEVDPLDYSTPGALLEAIIYKPVDKWSSIGHPLFVYILDQPAKQVTGHGISLALDQDNEPRVASIYKQSDLYARGVRRGWVVKTINGVLLAPVLMTEDPEILDNLLGGSDEGVKNTFEFINPEGTRVTLESTQVCFETDAVMMYDTLHLSSGITGYLLLDSFYDYDEEELSPVLSWLKSCNITDLIVDLRYNNVGSLAAARVVASAIAGNTYSRTDWLKINYNSDKADNQAASMRFITTDYDFGLTRVVFITSENTSAGSELIITGLRPYIGVTVVGSQTAGNPCGLKMFSYSLPYPGYVIYPGEWNYSIVAYEYMGTNETTACYDGIVPDISALDDVAHDFGDRNESCLAAAIGVLEGSTVTKSQVKPVRDPFIFNGEKSGLNNGATFIE